MRVTVEINGARHACTTPFEGAPYVECREATCPHCQANPIRVQGSGRRIESRDTYAADGYCAGCRGALGTLRAQMSTLFGLEEDERVLHGRARVY